MKLFYKLVSLPEVQDGIEDLSILMDAFCIKILEHLEEVRKYGMTLIEQRKHLTLLTE